MAAGLGFKTFTTGEVLTAGDVNGYLMQGVLVFASAAARNAAITSPQEGQFAFTKDTNGLWYYDGAAWVASGATGDIEGVSVTSPITGGGTSGTVTIGIDSTAVVPSQTGNSGKYLTTNGTASSWGTIGGIAAGTVISFAANAAPSGFLKANGAAISRSTYATLFTAIGTTFGVGDGSTTFNGPDLRGYFTRNWADNGSVDSGRSFGSTQESTQILSLGYNEDVAAGLINSDGNGASQSGTQNSVYNNGSTVTYKKFRPVNLALLACIAF
jgi:microcystin-dependent protein